MVTETLPTVTQNRMLFGLLHTRKCWALPILLGVPISQHQVTAKVLNAPFASLTLSSVKS